MIKALAFLFTLLIFGIPIIAVFGVMAAIIFVFHSFGGLIGFLFSVILWAGILVLVGLTI